MKRNYIGVKMIEAEAKTLGEYNLLRGWKIPPDEDPEKAGYIVTYPDGYVSWSPKAQFESASFPIEKPDCIGPDDVFAFIDVDNILLSKLGAKTAVAQARCVTGFEITASSSCVDADRYSQDIGGGIAMGRIQDALWGHLGFVLQWAKNGLTEAKVNAAKVDSEVAEEISKELSLGK